MMFRLSSLPRADRRHLWAKRREQSILPSDSFPSSPPCTLPQPPPSLCPLSSHGTSAAHSPSETTSFTVSLSVPLFVFKIARFSFVAFNCLLSPRFSSRQLTRGSVPLRCGLQIGTCAMSDHHPRQYARPKILGEHS